jgi:uncharacterized protein
MEANLRRILKKLHKALLARYGAKVSQVILFGSQARGEASADSDIDVLVVLEDQTEDFAREYENWSDWVSDEQRYNSVKSPLYLNIHSEGKLINNLTAPEISP